MDIPYVVSNVAIGIQTDYVHRLSALAKIYGVDKVALITASTNVLLETLKEIGLYDAETLNQKGE